MKFYRRLTPIKAISFDLDDTLYSNGPVMASIEQKMIRYFAEKLPDHQQVFHTDFWLRFKQEAILHKHELAHDVVVARFESYRLGFIALNFSADEANIAAQEAVDYFVALRSDFKVPQASVSLLEKLSQKLPLVAISNGNVDTKALGIAHFFRYIYHAGYQESTRQGVVESSLLRHKPATDMFEVVCKQLAILPEQLLHVGDCGNADIHGALKAGCQSAWLPHYGVGKPLKQVPHIELADVCELDTLL